MANTGVCMGRFYGGFFLLMLLLAAISGCGTVNAVSEVSAAQTPGTQQTSLTLEQVENKLVKGSYLQNLYAAYWAADQDATIIPMLETMLNNRDQYSSKQKIGFAFPFNAVWALAHMKDPAALAVLERYYVKSRDDDAGLAVAGYKLRSEAGVDCGVLLLVSGRLYSAADRKSPVVQILIRGQAVKVLQAHIENSKETGGRGGVQVYDYVELLPAGTRGYIPRAGDDFSPFI